MGQGKEHYIGFVRYFFKIIFAAGEVCYMFEVFVYISVFFPEIAH